MLPQKVPGQSISTADRFRRSGPFFVAFFPFFPLFNNLETIHFFTFQRLSKLRLFVIMPVSGAERPDEIASSNRPRLPSPGSDKRTTLPPGGPFVIGRRVAADNSRLQILRTVRRAETARPVAGSRSAYGIRTFLIEIPRFFGIGGFFCGEWPLIIRSGRPVVE